MCKNLRRVDHLRLLLLWLLAAPGFGFAAMEQAFDAGIRASRAGNHAEALRHFERARAGGLDRPALDYNLGVTLYRLGRFAEARRHFMRVVRHSALAALGHYNLGLVAERLGEFEEARREYATAWRLADEDKLKGLAALQLARLKRVEPEDLPRTIVVAAGGGYDDNLIVQETGGAAKVGDLFLDLLLARSGTVHGTPRDGVRLDGSLYLIEYFDESQFSMTFLRGGGARVRQWSAWRTEAGGHLELSTLGRLDYLRTLSLVLGATRRLSSASTIKLGYRFSGIRARDALFSELDGREQRLSFEGRSLAEKSRLYGLVFAEANDRADLREGGVFTSFSPLRAGARVEYGRDPAPGWEAGGVLGYVVSRFRDANALADGSEVRRRDDRIRVGLRVAKTLAPQWQLGGEYTHYRNNSNLGAFDYVRNVYMLRLSGVF